MVAQQAVILPAPPQPTDQWSRDYANQLYRWMESFQRQVTGFPYLRGSGLFFPEKALPTSDVGLIPGTIYAGGGALLIAGGGGSATDILAELAAASTPAEVIAALGIGQVESFVPTMMFGGASVGIAYNTGLIGSCIKIGQQVFVSVRMRLLAKGTSVGQSAIGNLPYPVTVGHSSLAVGFYTAMTGLTGALVALAQGGTSTITFRQTDVTGTTGVNETFFTNTSDVIVSGVYTTT